MVEEQIDQTVLSWVVVSQSDYGLQVAISTPEGGSRGYPCIKISLANNPPSPGKVGHTPGSTSQIFSNSGVGSFKSHKSQISESAVRRGLRFFVLIQED